MSEVVRTLRPEPRARLSVLGRASVAVLERMLPGLEGGTLEIGLPDGTVRRFGSGPAVRLAVLGARLFRRLATRGKLALGESYTAGEWRADDLPAFFELLLRNADAARARHGR